MPGIRGLLTLRDVVDLPVGLDDARLEFLIGLLGHVHHADLIVLPVEPAQIRLIVQGEVGRAETHGMGRRLLHVVTVGRAPLRLGGHAPDACCVQPRSSAPKWNSPIMTGFPTSFEKFSMLSVGSME